MYSKITDPKSGSEVNIHSKSGINIIKKYIISHGGAQNPTTLNISGKKKLIPKHIQSFVSKIMKLGFHYTNPKRNKLIKPLNLLFKHNFTIRLPKMAKLLWYFFL